MNHYKNLWKFSNCLFVIMIIYLSGCTPSKEVRYEKKPKEEIKEIESGKILKTMEMRERESIRNSKILSIDRINFEYDAKGKLINKGKISTVNYDQNGFLTKTIIYDEKGKVQNRFEYQYDKKGLRIQSLRFDSQNKLDKRYTYDYDENGNKIRSTRYNSNGKEEKYYLYEYDTNLNLVADEWYDVKGDLEYKIENEYDDSGLKTTSYSYDESGKLIYKYVFKYDNKMNVIEEQKFDNEGKLAGIIQYLYKYY